MRGWERLAAMTAAAVLSSSLLAPAPASALALTCWTGVHHNNDHHGFAFCSNDTNRTYTFRVVVVCGWAPDVKGNWVTLRPGQTGQSDGVCAFYSTGVGSVGVDERAV
ncbi:hypothetical protein [Salinactinospora qingdaonensis]|uniref:Secreted protein n=1 Tax=Salinactinospora qingdaonensis TaxID=702744 RepID=A0ABP7F9B2_9ACTN